MKIHFSLLLFMTCLLFTFLLWDFYFDSEEPVHQHIVANLVLVMGVLFSAASGLFVWSLESREQFLEAELKKRKAQIALKNSEDRKAEIATAAIYESGHLFFNDFHLEALVGKVMGVIAKALPVDEASLMLLDSEGSLSIAVSRGVSEDSVRTVHLRLGERVAELRREFLLVDGLNNYPEFQGLDSSDRIRSSILCPLVCQNQLMGVLNLSRIAQGENFSVADLLNVSIFASQVAMAVRNASLYSTLERTLGELESSRKRIGVLEDHLGR